MTSNLDPSTGRALLRPWLGFDGGAWRILDERLARGEIDAEEYQRLRDLLDGTGRAAAGSGSTR